MRAIAHEGCTDTVGEFALKKIPYRNLPERRAGPTLYQLSYIPVLP